MAFLKSVFTIACISIIFSIRADEGMWLPNLVSQLNMNKMTELGCKLSAKEIYDINNSSLKDAVVALDHGSCTGEIISANGLMLTNHHCGYDEIQQHSSVEHNYLKDGFWAATYKDELPNPGKSVSFLIKIIDVTDEINSHLHDTLSETARGALIQQVSDSLINIELDGTIYDGSVERMFKGNNFYMFIYQTFYDVRLVGAPPSSIGKFGGDTDNWMWPRHTGDFSMFRIYCAPDGSPAEYSEENVPLKPKHFLPISLKGIEKGDFAMVMGFPGTTDRYSTSWGVDQTMKFVNDTRIKVRHKKLEILKEAMDADEKIKIQYASKYSISSNYYKYSIGQNKGLNNLHVIERKEAFEKDFQNWIGGSDSLEEKYGQALPLIEKYYKDTKVINHLINYWEEAIWRGPEFIRFANSHRRLRSILITEDDESVQSEIKKLKADAEKHFKDYYAPIDEKLLIELFTIFASEVDEDLHPSIFREINKKYKGDMAKFAKKLFKKSFMVNQEKYMAFISSPSLESLEKDLAFEAMMSCLELYWAVAGILEESTQELNKGERLLFEARREMDTSAVFYPDANSTMRLTYGTVGDYKAKDAVIYKHYTTLKGVMEKEDPENDEFIVPQKLKQIYKDKDYGRYGKDGIMPVCFTTNNDITGGNSGSPVINANGELIGVAFDGNWEAMSGDIAFETKLQKCINVDIRYVLLIIDKFAGATHLINEMKIVK